MQTRACSTIPESGPLDTEASHAVTQQRNGETDNSVRIPIDLENEGGCAPIDSKRARHAKWFPGGHVGLDLFVGNVWREADVRARDSANRGSCSTAAVRSVIDYPQPRMQNAGLTAHCLPALDSEFRPMGLSVRLSFQFEERIAANHNPVDHFTVDQTTDNGFSLGPSKQLHCVDRRQVSSSSQRGILVDGGINQYWLNSCCAQRREPRR